MKHLAKLTSIFTLGLVVAFSACKKSDSVNNTPTDKTDYKALSKHIATSFAKSMNTGSTGFKTNGAAGGQRTLSTAPQCGQTVSSPYRETTTSGDTTRINTGNSLFTYICNNGVMNEYALVDTATSSELYPRYAAVYRVIQRYNTRATDDTYTKSTSNGTIGVAFVQRQFNNSGATTDSLTYATQYQLNNVIVTRSNTEAAVTGGQATFNASVFHKDNVVDVNGYNEVHSGVITFQEGNVFKVTFTFNGYSKSYLVNTRTGVVTEV